MQLTGPILALLLTKGLGHVVALGKPPPGWVWLKQAAGPTMVLRRSVVHCRPTQCRALVLSVDPYSGGSGALVTARGTAPCEFSVRVTDASPGHYCVSVVGCSLDGFACTVPR